MSFISVPSFFQILVRIVKIDVGFVGGIEEFNFDPLKEQEIGDSRTKTKIMSPPLKAPNHEFLFCTST
jgi:hypothetical protein